jgi:DNA-binding Lrp family transcriptional regulator
MQNVSDIKANWNDTFVYAAKKIGKSELKKIVFRAIYFGKQKIKTVSDLASKTKLSRKTILDTAKKLETDKLIHQVKHNSDTAYIKDDAYKGVWRQVLSHAGSKEKIDKIPTKVNPGRGKEQYITIKVPKAQVKIKQITIDDIESFALVKGVKNKNLPQIIIPETVFKSGILKILKETCDVPKDWGGEKNDIYTTRLVYNGKRIHSAFALKGPGKKNKKLMQRDMGKNGDQIQRLFNSSVQMLIVQYWREIDQSIVDLMMMLAIAKSYIEGRTIYFGIIDGNDSARLIQAYPKYFKLR